MDTRFGSTASDTLQALHRAADLELADDGGIAPLDDDRNLREPKPLKDYPPQWDVIATWAVIGLSTALLLGVFVHFVAQGLRADSGAVPAAQFSPEDAS